MNRAKYLLVFLSGIILYIGLSLFWGENSFKNYSSLVEQKKAIVKHKVDLEDIYTELSLEVSALYNDKAIIAAYARKLDYVADGEKIIKINGLKPYQRTLYDTGSVVRYIPDDFLSEKIIKICSIIFSFCVFLLFFIWDIKNHNITFGKKKKLLLQEFLCMKCLKSDFDSIKKCADSLKNAQVVIIPTDTVYGFSAIVDDESKTKEKIQKIKGRGDEKPFIQLISSPEDIKKYTDDKIPSKLLDYWPGPLTIIVNDKRINSTTAFRCPADEWLRKIIKECNAPIYSTSVNRSGNPILETENEILAEFNDEVDLFVLDGDKINALPSTIVSVCDGNFKIIRQGCLKIY